ncbi:MAG TPA: DMT family transporter [Bryobacteraceae bacterium]|nr:DMT family transporter [Bryobacteraceae bacterium]
MNKPAVLYALIVLMVAFWAGNYIAGKIALREFPPLLLAGVRIAMAGILILPLYAWRHGAELHSLEPRLVMLGLLGVTLNQVFFMIGLSLTSLAHAALINGLTPILVLLLAYLRGLERMTTRKVAGMIVALAGVALLKALEPASGGQATWSGDSFILCGALCFALFTVFGKETAKRYDSITLNTVAYVAGAIALSPITVWQAGRHPLATISAGAWMAVLYMAMFSSVVAYLIYYYALTRIAASRVAAFSYLQPVFALGLGAAILNESIGAPEIGSGLVILTGVYLAERG